MAGGKEAVRAKLVLQTVDTATSAAFQLQEKLRELDGLLSRTRDALAVLEATVHHALVDAHPPICPRCRGGMTARQNRETGGWFWGCLAYPGCKGSLDPMKWREEALVRLRAVVNEDAKEAPTQLAAFPERG